MGLSVGIVGLPNVGKSTLFNALTQVGIEAENYPFCTIEPNVGVVAVADKRLEQLAKIVQPEKVIATTMTFIDIAGLVKGAADGEGLGNQFLRHIGESEAIIHLVRCFEGDDIIHISGKIDALDDIETINTELILADMARVERALERNIKKVKAGDKGAQDEKIILESIKKQLDSGLPIRQLFTKQTDNDRVHSVLATLSLLTAKPVFYVANVSESGFKNNPHFDAVTSYAEKEGSKAVAICAQIEAEIAELAANEKAEFLAEMGQTQSGLERLISASYRLLNLQTFFTAGKKELRAWTIKIGDSAPMAGAKIHSDFQKGFIRAQTISFADFIAYNGEKGAKDAGKQRAEGKDYIVKDGDVINFLFSGR